MPPGTGPRERARRLRELKTRIGRQVAELRTEAGATVADLGRCADLDAAHVWRIEAGQANPSLAALIAIAACLGSDLGVRMFPAAGPRIHDRFQAPMVEALVRHLGPEWQAHPEVAVPAARGVIDVVLRRSRDRLTIVVECHSELRRLELVLRRLAEKADAVRAQAELGSTVSTMLLVRSTAATRAIVATYGSTIGAALPARLNEALDALGGRAAWPGPALIWARVETSRGSLLLRPPSSVKVGRQLAAVLAFA